MNDLPNEAWLYPVTWGELRLEQCGRMPTTPPPLLIEAGAGAFALPVQARSYEDTFNIRPWKGQLMLLSYSSILGITYHRSVQ